MNWSLCRVLEVSHSAKVDVYEMAEEQDASGYDYDGLYPWGLVIYFCNISRETYFWIDFCSLV